MTWYGVLAVILIIVGVSVLMKALYAPKDGLTPCTGCGACNGTGQCVLRRRELERRKQAQVAKAVQETGEKQQKAL